MTATIPIPTVQLGDLVLIVQKNQAPNLFYSDGKIAKLDDIGYPDQRTAIIHNLNFKGIRCGIYQYEHLWNEQEYDFSEGVRLFREELIAAGNYKDYLHQFGLEGNDTHWNFIFACSHGVALGYDLAQGFLRLRKAVESQFSFGGKEFKYRMPQVQVEREYNQSITFCSQYELQKIVVGAEAIKQE